MQIVCVQIPTEIFISQSVALNCEVLANVVEGYIAARAAAARTARTF